MTLPFEIERVNAAFCTRWRVPEQDFRDDVSRGACMEGLGLEWGQVARDKCETAPRHRGSSAGTAR